MGATTKKRIADAVTALLALTGYAVWLSSHGTTKTAGLLIAGFAAGSLVTRWWSRSLANRAITPPQKVVENDPLDAIATPTSHLETWRSIADHIVEGIITINSNGTIEAVNNVAAMMFGYGKKELLGSNVNQLVPEPFFGTDDQPFDDDIRTGKQRTAGTRREVTGHRKDGTRFPVDLSVGAGTIDGRRISTAVVRDNTKRNEMQSKLAQTERLASVGELAAGVAHEINNPINTMINCAQLIEDGDERTENCQIIIAEGARIADIIRALLIFAREDLSLAQPISLSQVVNHTMSLIGESWKRHSILLDIDIDKSLPLVQAHPQKVQQVLLDLMINAKNALLQRDIEDRKLKLTAKVIDDGISLEISDNGQAALGSSHQQIFDSVDTSDNSSSDTEFGISASRSIIEGYGGKINLRGQNGITTFTVWLPRAVDE